MKLFNFIGNKVNFKNQDKVRRIKGKVIYQITGGLILSYAVRMQAVKSAPLLLVLKVYLRSRTKLSFQRQQFRVFFNFDFVLGVRNTFLSKKFNIMLKKPFN